MNDFITEEEYHDLLPNEGTTSSTLEITSEEQDALDRAIESLDNEIPTNSPTLNMQETTSRFSSAIWYDAIQSKKIILAGLGGIGSYVAFLLSRMRPNALYVYDDDKVEAANMSGQLFSTNDIGAYKTNAVYRTVRNYSSYYDLICTNTKYSSNSEVSPIMICGFDNMEARKIFYSKWKNYVIKHAEDKNECLFIDGRLAAEEFQVIAIKGDDPISMSDYENNWLFNDSEAEATVCSYKQTTFMANMIASVMVNIFVNFVANECDPVFPRDVPFLTTYNAPTMYFKVKM